jgi:hypothetical protein
MFPLPSHTTTSQSVLWYQPQQDVYVYAMLTEVIPVFLQSLQIICRIVHYITEAGIALSLKCLATDWTTGYPRSISSRRKVFFL